MALQETPQDYTARILSYLDMTDPIEVLSATPERLRALISGRSRDDLAWTPDPSRWSVVQIVAHLADSEIVGAWRFRSILAADGRPVQAYDQDTWAETFRYADTDPFVSLEVFSVNREATVALLQRVDPKLRANHGMHQERGKETIEHLMRMYAGHDLNHLMQVEQLMQAR